MFQVPESVLNKLKCNLCDGYLNAKPVVVKDDRQICAKCYRILPLEERELCQRQIAFEAIGSCLVFPCRYHKMGCDYTLTWDDESAHESECKKRYFTIPDLVATNKDIPTYGPVNNGDESMHIAQNRANNTLEESSQTQLGTYQFPAINTNQTLYENIYSTISPKVGPYCLNCNTQIEKRSKNVCLFGHVTCINCKGDMCVACVKNLDGNSRIACKNASRGCKELLMQGDVGFHRDNCEFNEIPCPIDKCDNKLVLPELEIHLQTDHPNKVIVSDEFSKNVGQKDQNIVLLCYDGIFKCLYYYYVTSVEIVVVYLGPCVRASEFYFEVSAEANQKVIKKKLGCANWNNYMLAGGMNIDKKELKFKPEEVLKFRLNLKIHHVTTSG